MRVLAVLLACACLAAPAADAEDGAFVGVMPLDAAQAQNRDAARMARFEPLEGVLVASAPIAWGRIEPDAKAAGGSPYRWKQLDEAVLVWQLTGLAPVLVLSPESAWGSVAKDKSAWALQVRK
ncbi:MAG: hypothetical protein P1V36_08975, partial [Planctomycetota bacterium]|nr:hypothetical protein [Planctomycetota bacterium]